jgi:hypothetical protein
MIRGHQMDTQLRYAVLSAVLLAQGQYKGFVAQKMGKALDAATGEGGLACINQVDGPQSSPPSFPKPAVPRPSHRELPKIHSTLP